MDVFGSGSPILAAVEYGWYISLWKVAVFLLVLLAWARLMTWVDKDAEAAHLPRIPLNAGFMVGLIVGFALFIAIPGFLVALALFVVVFVVEIAAYLIIRNQKVGLKDLGDQFKAWLRSFSKGSKEIKAEAGAVLLINRKGTPFPPPLDDAPERAGYVAVQDMLSEPLRRGADRIELKPGDGTSTVKYSVDGVEITGRAIPKADAGSAVMLLKELTGLDLNDRRKPQQGTMKAAMDGKKKELQINTAGSNAGESVVVEVEPKKRHELRIDELGFSEDQLAKLDEVIGEGEGIVLLSTPRGHGLTSLLYAVLRRHDAFLSHIQTIERAPAIDLEGITQNNLPPGAPPAEETKLASWVASQEPDVLMIDKVTDPKTAHELVKFSEAGHRVYVGIRAGSTFEALQVWRSLVRDDKLAAKALRFVVSGRLARKLCAACKMDYNPDPDTLRKLNMPPERVGKLYTARNTPLHDAKGREIVCEFCLDLRFKGRTGIYEMFAIDDEVKAVLAAGGSVNQLKMLFKKQRQKYLQEIALGRAVAGDTSLQEVVRVLKAGDPPATGSSSSSAKKPVKT